MATAWISEALDAAQRESDTRCVQCQRAVVYIRAKNAYERIVRNRQMIHRLCERCARVTSEVGEHMDGLWRKKRFLEY